MRYTKAQIFVAVLGASSYTYAEATLSQQVEDWIGSHVRTFSFFGGVTEAIVPDNLKSGVSPERFSRWAAKIGPQTKVLTETLLVQRAHPQQAYRTLLGILRLGKAYGEQRLEAACDRALHINALSYRSIESILKSGLDQKPLQRQENSTPIQHGNIRGADYYDSTIH